MAAQSLPASRFVRKTQLGPGEYRRNFRQIDDDVIEVVTSEEADAVTPLMSKIYLKLVRAPAEYRERDGVLHFTGEAREEGHVTAWDALCDLVGVASATARKALLWMHGQGIIGYFAGKNGVGIRVFLNRASSSIGTRPAGQKILAFPRASSGEARTSPDEAAFMDSFAVIEILDSDVNPRAPQNGADKQPGVKNQPDQARACSPHPPSDRPRGQSETSHAPVRIEVPVEEIVSRLRRELETSLQSAARAAASREHERTREWLETRGLPKAARVAQREAYNVLRRHGVAGAADGRARAEPGAGRQNYAPQPAKALTPEEVREVAESCVAMLEIHGRPVDETLAEIGTEGGGFLLPEDAAKVRELAASLARGGTRAG